MQYLDSDLSAGVTYHYRVAAIGQDQQQTGWSYPAQAMAFVAAPSDLQIVSTTANSISLSWTIHTTGVPNYVLLFNDGSEGQGIIVLPNDATSYTLPNVFPIPASAVRSVAISVSLQGRVYGHRRAGLDQLRERTALARARSQPVQGLRVHFYYTRAREKLGRDDPV